MVDGQNNERRLVINLPPRTLKTFIVSKSFVAWLLGRDPTSRRSASYAADLADKLSRDCRALIGSKFYKRVFPRTRLNPKRPTRANLKPPGEDTDSQHPSEAALLAEAGTSSSSMMRSKLLMQIPKPPCRQQMVGYSTVASRLDHPSLGLIIVTMQRLHVDDLAGILIESGWPTLAIPAIATEPTDYVVAADEVYSRPAGEVLQPDRNCIEILDEIKRQIGSRHFAAQYQQNPAPTEGNLIKADWLVIFVTIKFRIRSRDFIF